MMEEDEKDEETHFDRRKNYRALIASGVSDSIAKEKVWPSTSAGMVKKAKEASDRKEQEGSKKSAE